MISISDLTVERVAAAMGIQADALVNFSMNTHERYLPTNWKNVKGKTRPIDEPMGEMKRHLARLNGFVLRNFRFHTIVHGGLLGHSCYTSADVHTGRPCVITRDIRDCYPSITTAMLMASLQRGGLGERDARVLSSILTVHNRIPQGSPASGIALNLFFHEFDQRIASYCGRYGLNCTRTYDDIVVSVPRSRSWREIARLAEIKLEEEISKAGLEVNRRKAKRRGFQQANRIQLVHNLVVNDRRGVAIPSSLARKVCTWAQEYVASARAVDPTSLPALAKKRQRLFGYVSHFNQAHSSPSKYISDQIKVGDRLIETRLIRSRAIWPGARWRKLSACRVSVDNIAKKWAGHDLKAKPCNVLSSASPDHRSSHPGSEQQACQPPFDCD